MFIHYEQLVGILQKDSTSFWFQLYPKLKEDRPELTEEEIQKRLFPSVNFLFLSHRPGKPTAVCLMPAYLIKSYGQSEVFSVDLAFETAVQDVYDVKRGVRVVALKNLNPTDESMSFAQASDRDLITRLLAPGTELKVVEPVSSSTSHLPPSSSVGPLLSE